MEGTLLDWLSQATAPMKPVSNNHISHDIKWCLCENSLCICTKIRENPEDDKNLIKADLTTIIPNTNHRQFVTCIKRRRGYILLATA
jgi:hypothetical protein